KKIWDDFDFERYRDHVMAYPTINGVIPTIQWEGFREGVDDVKCLTTLIYHIERARNKKSQNQAASWLEKLDVHCDLSILRKKMNTFILFLRNQNRYQLQ
ncbi:MAG: hypothetical protein DRP81_07310, partial [Candidatus Omnitrophota bacterium]